MKHQRSRWMMALSILTIVGAAGCDLRAVLGSDPRHDAGGTPLDAGSDLDAAMTEDAGHDAPFASPDAGPCGRACPPGRVCDPILGGCVECVSDADCPGTRCHPDSHQCVECLDSTSCRTGEFCDASFRCVPGCASDADCTMPGAPACDPSTHRCVPCLSDAHCPGATPHCLPEARRCVECVGVGADPECPLEAPYCDDDNMCVQCLASEHCGPATACSVGGVCSPVCSAGSTCGDPRFSCCVATGASDGLCIDTNLGDVANCGGCGVECADLLHSSPVCRPGPRGSLCGISCDSGRGDCDGDASTDCEVDVAGDPAHCGGCGRVCDLNRVDVHGCESSECTVVECDTGFADCNDRDVDGCEQRLDSRLHCGDCDVVCENSCGSAGCQVAIDVSLGHRHALAVMEDGAGRRTVQCLGASAERPSGMCGDGVGFPACGITTALLPEGIRWSQVGAGANFGCALGDGRVFCWGENGFGQVGNGTATRQMRPADTGLTTAVQLTVGLDHACARLADGSVWCWGSNESGKAGLGSLSGSADRPARVIDGGIVVVRAGGRHTCAVRDDGAALCWGLGLHGRLGNASVTSTGTPSVVMTGPGVRFVDVQPQQSHTCAVTAAGEMYCWGNNTQGQLCTGDRVIQPIPRLVQTDVDRMVGVFDPWIDDAVTVWRSRSGILNACGAARFLSRSVTDVNGTTTPVTVSYHDCDPGGAPVTLAEHSLYSTIVPYITGPGLVDFEGFGPPLGWSCAPGVCSSQYPFRI